MPRIPRVIIPSVPLHITQRGVDRCPTFLAADDFAFYRWLLREASLAASCAVHSYALMTNHVHLLVTPRDARGPAHLMRSLGMRYVRYFNDRYRRTGTLWEGRFRSVLVDSSAHLFACYRYIELNPVHAGMVGAPDHYEWSSYACNARGDDDPAVTHHPLYLALAGSPGARCVAYRALFAAQLEESAVAALRAPRRGRAKLHPSTYQQAVAAMAAGDSSAASSGTAGSDSDDGIRP